MSKVQKIVDERIQSILQDNLNLTAIVHNMQRQMAQLSESSSSRPQGTLPSNTEKNPREEAKVITLRSGKELNEMHQYNPEVSKDAEMSENFSKDKSKVVSEKNKDVENLDPRKEVESSTSIELESREVGD